MKHLLSFLVLVTAAITGDVKLPSGRVLKNAVIGPMVSTQPSFPRTLTLKYETSVDFGSRKAISGEVEEIWQTFRLEVEKGKYEGAIRAQIRSDLFGPPLGRNLGSTLLASDGFKVGTAVAKLNCVRGLG